MGVVLALINPSLAGEASGSAFSGTEALSPVADDGFVPPPPMAGAKTEPAPPLDPAACAARESREAHAEHLIEKLIVKMRGAREARAAARRDARAQAQSATGRQR